MSDVQKFLDHVMIVHSASGLEGYVDNPPASNWKAVSDDLAHLLVVEGVAELCPTCFPRVEANSG